MIFERILAAIVSVAILTFTGAVIWRNEPFADQNQVVAMRVALSLGTAVLGATVPGFLNMSWKGKDLAVRAGGALALFALTYLITPTVLARNDSGPSGGTTINQTNGNGPNIAIGSISDSAPPITK